MKDTVSGTNRAASSKSKEHDKKEKLTDDVTSYDEEYNERKQKTEVKGKRTRWITRAMADDFSRYDVLMSTCKEAFIYLFFIAAVSMCTVGRRKIALFYLNHALTAQFIEKGFTTVSDVGITFKEIKTSADFWFYTEQVVLDGLYWETYYGRNDFVRETPKEDRRVLYENILMGVPRIRQLRIKSDSCKVHKYFKKYCKSCYDTYSKEAEDRSPFGLKKKTAWVYTSQTVTGHMDYHGEFATYGGGGYYQDLSRNRNKSAEIIAELKENLWITRATRAVFINFLVYNPNLNAFCICRINFEFPPTGGVRPDYQFRTFKLLKFSNRWSYITFGFECTVYVMAGFFLIEEIREIMYFKLRYFLQFWTYIDLSIIAAAAANLLTSLVIFPSAKPSIKKIINNPDEYGNLEYLQWSKNLYVNFAASLLFLSYIKLFKFLNFNKTMGQLNNTLKNCSFDILGFSIMFFIIFIAFAELGYLLFGSEVKDFSNFSIAMFTLFRTILGDFEYDEIKRANKVLAPIYFLSYIFFVFFILLNMFLAIINDTYSDVKTEIALAPDEMPMTEFLQKEFYKLLRALGCKVKYTRKKFDINATVQQIRDALKNCGFTDLEIEMFFARYNIDPYAVVADYDIKKIVKGLEEQIYAKEGPEDQSMIQVSDFISQQERLDQIERTIKMISTKINNIVRRIQEYENLRREAP